MVENRSRREFLSRITVAAGTFAIAGTSLLAVAGDDDEHTYYERPWKLAGKLTAKRFEVRSDALTAVDPAQAAAQVV